MNLPESVRQVLRTAVSQANSAVFDEKGYVRDFRENLLPGVEETDFRADLDRGSGQELQGKFRAPHSSSALAVNSFAPFRRRCGDLQIPGISQVRSLAFEARCPCGLSRATPPTLDVLLDTETGHIGIESKLSEFLASHTAHFSPRYRTELPKRLRHGPWFAEMLELIEEPRRYRFLDAAQLIKHAFGLSHQFRDKTPKLLYLFWEPCDRASWTAFAHHRAEIEEFAGRVSGGSPEFAHMSYPELWDHWAQSGHAWVQSHVEALCGRYAVALS